MIRISRNQLFMEVANTFAKRSTCYRQNIGAVLVSDRHIVSHGYNGPASGQDHCTGQRCPLTSTGGCSRSIHAEINALANCRALYPLTLYVTQSPCENCAKEIILDARVDRIFYGSEYRIKTGIENLLKNGIDVFRITTSGYIINLKNNELVENE